MTIDKLELYYTDRERALRAADRIKIDKLTNAYTTCSEKINDIKEQLPPDELIDNGEGVQVLHSYTNDELKQLLRYNRLLLKHRLTLMQREKKMRNDAIIRYRDAVAADPDTIKRDCKEILAAITLEEYLDIIQKIDALDISSAIKDLFKYRRANYEDYRKYLREVLNLQYEICKELNINTDAITKAISRKAEKAYPASIPPKRSREREEKANPKRYSIAPYTPFAKALKDLSGASTPEQLAYVFDDRGGKISITGELSRELTFNIKAKGENKDLTFVINDISDLDSNGIATKKILFIILAKMNELNAFKKDYPSDNTIVLTARELVDKGAYSSTRTARRALNTSLDAIVSARIKLRDSTTDKRAIIPMFSYGEINEKTGETKIIYNKELPWHTLCDKFALYPNYIYTLGENAFNLTDYIFTRIAEQRGKKDLIKTDAAQKPYIELTISLHKVIHLLQLNLDNAVKRSQVWQLIIKPIEKALNDIQTKHNQKTDKNELSLELCIDNNLSNKEMIERGYIKVKFSDQSVIDHYKKPSKKARKKSADPNQISIEQDISGGT